MGKKRAREGDSDGGAKRRKSNKAVPVPVPGKETWTYTFSESVENHRGMECLGTRASEGFTIAELVAAQKVAEAGGCRTELIDLQQLLPADQRAPDTEAQVLVVRGGLSLLLPDAKDREAFVAEVKASSTRVDKKAWMYGRVVDKEARWNLCFTDTAQTADYDNKKGTVIAFNEVPFLKRIREALPAATGTEAARGLFAELNYYYNKDLCGIRLHGDTERRRVIGLRVGASMNLRYHWFHRSAPVGTGFADLVLSDGDFYIMSDKAVGHDWKSPTLYTLRHCAGAAEYCKLPKPKKKSTPKKAKAKK